MKIKFCMRTKLDNNSGVDTQGEVSSKKELIERFKEFVNNHGTGFNDFDEFACAFVKGE